MADRATELQAMAAPRERAESTSSSRARKTRKVAAGDEDVDFEIVRVYPNPVTFVALVRRSRGPHRRATDEANGGYRPASSRSR